MERSSAIYKIRRKLQVMAHQICSDEFMSKVYFYIVLRKKLDLKNPKTFNEKMQWLKLYYFPKNPLVVKCSDKFVVREYIESRGYKDKLVPLIGVWNRASEIDWQSLPEKYILKATHGCGYNISYEDAQKMGEEETKKQLDKWLREDFGAFNIEPHYSQIKDKKIICEKFLGGGIQDYKFFCFNGEPKYIYVSNDLLHDRQAQIGFFYLDGKKMPLTRDDYTDIPEITLPNFFDDMLAMAKNLCEDFPFVRVDFFLADDTYYFAELTFTPGACMMPFNPDRYDLEWGKMIELEGFLKKIR